MKFFVLTVMSICLAAMVKAQCNAGCTRELAPVCAVYLHTNDKLVFRTHANPCLLKYYKCMNPTKEFLTSVDGKSGKSCSDLGFPETTSD